MTKTKLLYGLLMGASVLLTLQSNSSGRAAAGGDNSGRTGSNCAQCHSDNNSFSSSLSIQVADLNGNAVTAYMPGETYRVTYTVNASGASAYGMQAVAVDGSNAQAGSLTATSSNAKVSTLGGRSYLEQNSRSTSNTFTADWVAPAAGTGTVTIYGAGMAVNSNFGTSGDDPTAAVTASLTESNATGVRDLGAEVLTLKLFPVPNSGTFTIENAQREAVEYVRVFTLSGVEVAQQQVNLPQGSAQVLTFDALVPGVYQVVAEGETMRQVRSMVVQ